MSGLNIHYNKDANIGYNAVQIATSKGKDTITLGNGSEVVEFGTGGGRNQDKQEVTTIDLGNFDALEINQTLSFNGITIINNGTNVMNQRLSGRDGC